LINEWGINQLIANGESDLSLQEIQKGKGFYKVTIKLKKHDHKIL
jgi:hypothetical protein